MSKNRSRDVRSRGSFHGTSHFMKQSGWHKRPLRPDWAVSNSETPVRLVEALRVMDTDALSAMAAEHPEAEGPVVNALLWELAARGVAVML